MRIEMYLKGGGAAVPVDVADFKKMKNAFGATVNFQWTGVEPTTGTRSLYYLNADEVAAVVLVHDEETVAAYAASVGAQPDAGAAA